MLPKILLSLHNGNRRMSHLKNVAGRAGWRWLLKFIADPRATIESGDRYAIQHKDEVTCPP